MKETQIPSALRRYLRIRFSIGCFLFLAAALHVACGTTALYGFIAFAPSIWILARAAYLRRRFRKQEYIEFSGVCTETGKYSVFPFAGMRVVMESWVTGDRFGFKVPSFKQCRIMPGMIIKLYIPDDSFVAESGGIFWIVRYFGYSVMTYSVITNGNSEMRTAIGDVSH